MDESKKVKNIIKWLVISIIAIIIAFITSRLFIWFINEFLRSNWNYKLFEKNSSIIAFANWIMFTNLLLEILFVYIFYKMRKKCKYS